MSMSIVAITALEDLTYRDVLSVLAGAGLRRAARRLPPALDGVGQKEMG
jgi:hypothetical protein